MALDLGINGISPDRITELGRLLRSDGLHEGEPVSKADILFVEDEHGPMYQIFGSLQPSKPTLELVTHVDSVPELLNQGGVFDTIFLDNSTPGSMRGVELLVAMKEGGFFDNKNVDTVVVFNSADSGADGREAVLEMLISGYLPRDRVVLADGKIQTLDDFSSYYNAAQILRQERLLAKSAGYSAELLTPMPGTIPTGDANLTSVLN